MRGSANSDQATRYLITEGLGDVLMLRGRYDEAAQQTEAARELAEGEVAKAQIEGKLGELAFKRGDMKTAMHAIERALERLGHRVPQWSGAYLFRLAGEGIVQVLHSLLPRLFVARKKLDEGRGHATPGAAPPPGRVSDVEKELLIVRLQNRLTYRYWFKRGQIPVFVGPLARHEPGREISAHPRTGASVFHPCSRHVAGAVHQPGIAYAQQSFAIYKSLGDLWGQGQSSSFHGMVLYAAARFEEALEKFREAVRLLERTGDYWEVNIARYHSSNTLHRLGDLPAAVAEARRVHRSGLELGDIQATGICHARLGAGFRRSGRSRNRAANRARTPSATMCRSAAQVMMAEGVRVFAQDRFEDAADLFEKAYRLAEKAGVRNAWTYPTSSPGAPRPCAVMPRKFLS